MAADGRTLFRSLFRLNGRPDDGRWGGVENRPTQRSLISYRMVTCWCIRCRDTLCRMQLPLNGTATLQINKNGWVAGQPLLIQHRQLMVTFTARQYPLRQITHCVLDRITRADHQDFSWDVMKRKNDQHNKMLSMTGVTSFSSSCIFNPIGVVWPVPVADYANGHYACISCCKCTEKRTR